MWQHYIMEKKQVSGKNRLKKLLLWFLKTTFDYKIIYLQKNIAECMQTYVRTRNFFRI